MCWSCFTRHFDELANKHIWLGNFCSYGHVSYSDKHAHKCWVRGNGSIPGVEMNVDTQQFDKYVL